MGDSGSKKIKAGSFQSMGLDKNILKGLLHMGYKTPTPVQRKSLPIALAGMDMVCMARTGSGKTCAFLLPMLQKLKTHDVKSGVRAIILSPTRELAMQTFRFTKEMAKHTDLRIVSVVGGDGIEEQFERLSSRPDIIIATPGRLMHQIREIPTFKLKSVKYLVFDEADRLFEMGFADQLNEILREVPAERQTLLFSATLPKMLVQFTRAGLRDPQLIRLDTDCKLSDELRLGFLFVRSTEKVAALLYLFRRILPPGSPTIVFTATRHHSEFLHNLLQEVGVTCTLVYGNMDHEQRAVNLKQFRQGEVQVLVVTDLAARGIDIPLLDHVVNFHFPASPKLFVHRCGRAARQGRIGFAWSLVDTEELAYAMDVHNFLGKPLENSYQPDDGSGGTEENHQPDEQTDVLVSQAQSQPSSASQRRVQGPGLYTLDTMEAGFVHTGVLPQDRVDEENELLKRLLNENPTLANQWMVCEKAMQQYHRTRSEATHAGIKQAKAAVKSAAIVKMHPVVLGMDPDHCNAQTIRKTEFIKHLQSFRPQQTVFESGIGTGCTSAYKKGVHKIDAAVVPATVGGMGHGVEVMRALRQAVAPGLIRNRRSFTQEQQQAVAGAAEDGDSDGDGEDDGSDDGLDLHTDEFDGLNDVSSEDGEDDGHEEGREGRDGEQGVTAAQHGHLSKHMRRKLKAGSLSSSNSKPTSSSTRMPEESSGPASSRPKGERFRDERFYMGYGDEDTVEVFAEESMQPQSGLRASERLHAHQMERALLDITPDEAVEMNNKKRMLRWDAKKRKFVKQTLEEMAQSKGAKRVRTESGAVVRQSTIPQGELYKKWRAKSHREVNTGPSDAADFDDRPAPNFKVNKHVRDELRSAPEIRKIQEKKDKMKLKNMNKADREKVLKRQSKKFKEANASAIRNSAKPNSRSKLIVRY